MASPSCPAIYEYYNAAVANTINAAPFVFLCRSDRAEIDFHDTLMQAGQSLIVYDRALPVLPNRQRFRIITVTLKGEGQITGGVVNFFRDRQFLDTVPVDLSLQTTSYPVYQQDILVKQSGTTMSSSSCEEARIQFILAGNRIRIADMIVEYALTDQPNGN